MMALPIMINGPIIEVVCPTHCFTTLDQTDFTLYQGFANEDVNIRRSTYDYLKNTLCAWLEGYGSPQPNYMVEMEAANGGSTVNGYRGESSLSDLVSHHLPVLYCLSVQCPLEDVRDNCKQLLTILDDRGVRLNTDDMLYGPSSFIPVDEVMPVDSQDDETKVLFTQAFLQNNRLDHLTQVMGFHPQYLTSFLQTQNTLLREEGPLPFHYRHYIAMIAASRHQCAYLVHLHAAEYLRCGGDRSWLESLDNVPTKLRNLQEINRLLAHRPWLVTSHHIEKLCHADRNKWTLSELTHAIVLMTHFHSMCSAVFGCGINFELDDSAGRLLNSDGESSGDSDNESSSTEQTPLEGLIERLKQLKDEAEGDYSEEENRRRFDAVESQTAEINGKSQMNGHIRRTCSNAHLVEQPDFTYADFIKFKETTQTFRASDYTWETHGYSIANRYYPDIGVTLDDKFTIAKEFTYYTVGDKYTDVNTQDFRTAIWNYIHCILGIRHDDYDYAKVNSLLERNLKSFIKDMSCFPERLTKKDFDGVMKGFTYSEKIHVAIILMEARMQAELLYALRAVSQFMT